MNKALFFSLLIVLLVSACTSDKHYQKYFSRNGGVWDITVLKWQRVESAITTQNVLNGENENAGYISFDGSGTAIFEYSFDTFIRQGIASWSAQDGNIQLVYDNVQGGAPATSIVSLRIDKKGTNKSILQGTENWIDNIGSTYTNTFSYELKRRD
jgi:hypothetical protein